MDGSLGRRVLLTGGAGYVGSALVPKLLEAGHEVTNLDLYVFGEDVLASVASHPGLREVKGDIRDRELVRRQLQGQEAVVHLACISNDPCFELDPELGKSINYDATVALLQEARQAGVKRFIYASTSSVYGVKSEEQVTEDLPLEPLTDYSKYKGLCEKACLKAGDDDFIVTVVRPATVCGCSARQRFDVIVNILANHAYNTGKIRVFGGAQYRPNIHIEDMAELYVLLLSLPGEKLQKGVYNAGYENRSVEDLATMVREVMGKEVVLERVPTQDPRSYRVNSDKLRKELGFVPKRTIRQAVEELKLAFGQGQFPNSMEESRYFNIKRMREIRLQ